MSTIKKGAADAVDRPGVGALLRRAWQVIRRDLYESVRSHGFEDLNAAHVAIFRYEGIEGRRPTQLAEELQLTKQSLNGVLRHLEQAGYLTLAPDGKDGRARRIRLTARGHRLDSVIRTQAQRIQRNLEKKLGGHRVRELRKILLQISNAPDRGDS